MTDLHRDARDFSARGESVSKSVAKRLRAQQSPERRFQRFQDIGCIACYKHGEYRQADAHHLLSGGRRRGHRFTIPLCPYHHRGIGCGPGPSLAGDGSRAFHREYGTDDELLEQTDRLIEAVERVAKGA